MEQLNEKSLVTKSNYLVEASYRLTLQEQRIILIIASMIQKGDKDFKTYKIEIQDFMRLINVTGKSKYKEVKEITKRLRERTVVLKDIKEDTETQVGWVSSFKYYNQKGYVQIRLDPDLRPWLLNLKNQFTQYHLKYALSLKGSYSIRIYELLRQFFPNIKERNFKLEELKETLGIKESEYQKYGHFKSRILKKAQKDINGHTDITFIFKEIKIKRKVTEIIFFIYKHEDREKEELEEEKIDREIENIELYSSLQTHFCLSRKQAKQVMKEYKENPDKIEENLKHVESRNGKKEIKNIGAYTLHAIKEDIRDQLSLFAEQEKKEQRELIKQQKLKAFEYSLEQQFDKNRKKRIEEYKQTLSPEEIELNEVKIKKLVIKKQGENKIGLKLFLEIERKSFYAGKAGMETFSNWKEIKLKEFVKKQNIN